MLACGKNVVKEIIKNNVKIKKCYISKEFSEQEIINNIYDVEVIIKDKNEMDRILEKNQGIIVEIDDYKYVELSEIINKTNNSLIVMLDHIEDPHNFGAIIRTCEASGVDGIIIPKDRSIEINSTVMKTSAGALTNIKVSMVTNLVDTISKLKKEGYWIIGLDLNGQDYNEINYNMPICLIVGNEGSGLKSLTKKNCDIISSIPMKGKINSLNASVAAGIMIYQILNKRK